MKVQIIYTETITREMTKAEYKQFLKMNKYEQDQKYNFCSECSDEHHLETQIVSIQSELI